MDLRQIHDIFFSCVAVDEGYSGWVSSGSARERLGGCAPVLRREASGRRRSEDQGSEEQGGTSGIGSVATLEDIGSV